MCRLKIFPSNSPRRGSMESQFFFEHLKLKPFSKFKNTGNWKQSLRNNDLLSFIESRCTKGRPFESKHNFPRWFSPLSVPAGVTRNQHHSWWINIFCQLGKFYAVFPTNGNCMKLSLFSNPDDHFCNANHPVFLIRFPVELIRDLVGWPCIFHTWNTIKTGFPFRLSDVFSFVDSACCHELNHTGNIFVFSGQQPGIQSNCS